MQKVFRNLRPVDGRSRSCPKDRSSGWIPPASWRERWER
jgi:hypothetical protein